MSSLDDADIPSASFQKAELSGYLNSNMLVMFLMGVYTIIYCWTFYIYLHSKAAHHISILGVITLIYGLSFVQTGIYWYQNNQTFVDNADTMLDAFNFMDNGPPSPLQTINDACMYLTIVLADGLLMWRCYVVWTGSRRIGWIPCVLWLFEAVLSIVLAAADVAGVNDFSDAHSKLMNVHTAALCFTSALTSLISTYLIAYRIYTVSRLTGASKKRLKNVIDIVVQSSAGYTLSVLAVAIYDVVPFQNSDSATLALDTVIDYMGSIALILVGTMPTLMVARVAMSSGNDGTTVVLVLAGTAADKPSAIHFQSRGSDVRESWNSMEAGKLYLDDQSWKKDASQLDQV
ncbi:hypothetical protein D9613_007334 [Agrocybe pediades]|uniref:Uncharacterized protein n=1 Tax=Agrocybe pediades TaxID=84607 RepID=A0A8H4VID6_9AGAR|nr:hypothetical protein D9613_007334 [Agrocybe pediades]